MKAYEKFQKGSERRILPDFKELSSTDVVFIKMIKNVDNQTYPIHCILPHGRFVHMSDSILIPYIENDETLASLMTCSEDTITLYDKNSSTPETISLTELGNRFNFQYTPFLTFLHEKELRSAAYDFPDIDRSEFQTIDFNIGRVHPNLSVKHIGMIKGVDIGFGLFVEQNTIKSNQLIGEYCGIVSSNETLSGQELSYCCQYPSCDGKLMINASDSGNIIRFINHSNNPNAEFRSCMIFGIMHIFCVSS